MSFPVIVKECRGPAVLSNQVIDAYSKYPGVTRIVDPRLFDRTNKRLAKVITDSPHKNKLYVVNVPKQYASYYFINHFEGIEYITVDFAQYQKDKITEINAGSSGDKEDEIIAFLENSSVEKLSEEFERNYHQ